MPALEAVVVAGTDTWGGEQRLANLTVGGISILTRVMRSLRRAGVQRITLLMPKGEAGAVDYGVDVRVVEHGHALSDAVAALTEAADGLPDRFWVVTVDRVVSPGVFPDAATEIAAGAVSVCDASGAQIGVYVLSREDVSAAPRGSLPALVETLGAQRVDAGRVVWHSLRDAGEMRAAHARLLASLRKPLGRQADGVVAYYLNRPISLRLSSWLVGTPITPNHVTTLGLFLGLWAAALVSTGQWEWMVLGGFALQLSSIADGIDGEIARMRLTTSHGGEWYDTVSDDVINVGFMFGLGMGAFHQTGDIVYLYAGLGGAAVAITVVSALYVKLVRTGLASHNNLRWGFERDEGEGRSGVLWWPVKAFSYAAKRDSYTVLLLVLLVANWPSAALFLMVGGIILMGLGLAIQLAASSFGVGDSR